MKCAEKSTGFTKDDTLVVKGVAIIFLLLYHCFSSVSRLNGHEVNFWPLSQQTVIYVTTCMVHCVGMFAFLSVYGLTLTLKKMYPKYDFNGREASLFVLGRYIKLVLFFAVPFFICTGVTFLTDTSCYSGTTWQNIVSIVVDFFGVGYLCGTEYLINTWWYLSLEVVLIVFLPLVLRMYKKFGWLIILMFLIPGSFMIEKHVHLTKYLFVMPLAVCFADADVLRRLKEWQPFDNYLMSKMSKFVVTTAAIVIFSAIWSTEWGLERFEFLLSGLIPMLIIYWCYEFILDIPILRKILMFLGMYSATVFYVHSFIRTLWLGDLTYSFGHAALIWGFLMGSSILIAILIDWIKKLVRYNKISADITERIVGWAGQKL